MAAAVAVTVAWRRRRKALRAADWYAAELPGDSQVVVVPSAQVDAFALPSRPGRIVVTTAMRDTLADDRYAAVIAHERCHLEQRHHDLVWLARLGAAVHPLLAPMVRHVEYLVERAADEAAADVLGNRREVARAIGTVALRAGGPVVPSGMLRLAARHGAVPRRVRALLGARLRARVLVAVPAVLAVSTIVWTGECVYDLQELLRAASLPDLRYHPLIDN